MNKKIKSTLIFSAIGIVVLSAGFFVYKSFIKPFRDNKGEGGGEDENGTPPVPQPTITRDAAMGIANTLHSEMDGCNTDFVTDFKQACGNLKNSLDWQLVMDAFGNRYTDGCAPFTGHTGNLVSTMKWELETEEVSECRSFLNSKGISTAL